MSNYIIIHVVLTMEPEGERISSGISVNKSVELGLVGVLGLVDLCPLVYQNLKLCFVLVWY